MTTTVVRGGIARAQRGRTLIELLIAMVLSLIIIAAVGVLYDVTSRTSRTAQQLGTAEEGGRLVMYFLSEPVALAGYGNVDSTDPRFQATSFDLVHLRGCTNGRFADPKTGDFTCVPSASGAPGDALYIAYQAESIGNALPQGTEPMTDCLGQAAVAVGTVPVIGNSYSIEFSGAMVPQFSCEGLGAAATQGLVRNVEDFKVYFGFDLAAYNLARGEINNLRPSALMSAADINALPGVNDPPNVATNPWNYVVSAQVCVQVQTAQAGVTPDGTSVVTPCPQTVAQAADPTTITPVTLTDGIARRTYSQVFTIRARGQALAGSRQL